MSVGGLQQPADSGSDYAALSFMVMQRLLKLSTCTLVKVVRVTNTGGFDPVGFVDVLPLVTQVTAEGVAVAHGTLHNVPYFRLQGGANAVIIDPEVGDIGMCSFASRDISAVKSTRAEAAPGSLRYCDWADGMYFGGLLNATPTQYVQFNADGVTVHSPVLIRITAPEIDLAADTLVRVTAPTIELMADTEITLTAPSITLDGAVTQSGGTVGLGGALTAPSVATDAGVGLGTHHHGGVLTGGGNTGGPVG